MLDAQPSDLDTKKLIKLRELMNRGSSEGERQAARVKAMALAKQAGMTLDQALSELDAPKAPDPAAPQQEENTFQRVFREMREKRERMDPGCLAREAAEKAQKRQEVIDRYGSEDAVFEETEREHILSAAVERHLSQTGSKRWCDIPSENRRQIAHDAYPMPTTVADAWAEYSEFEDRATDRCTVDRGYCDHRVVWARQEVLSDFIAATQSQNTKDLRARLDWSQHAMERVAGDHIWGTECTEAFAALRADVERLMDHLKELHRQQPQPTTASERAIEVRRILKEEPGLSDREIARRTSVSPQTVCNWRHAMAENKGKQ